MITITHTDNSVTVRGHANYAEKGYDIICAAISTLNHTLALTGEMVKEEGGTTVSTDNKNALEVILNGFKAVAEVYPQYVEVVE